MIAYLLALSLSSSVALPQGRPPDAPVDLVELAHRFCIETDGDAELTWDRAVASAFVPLAPDPIRALRLPGARGLRGYSRTHDGVEVRVLTARNTIRGFGNGETAFSLCWVSATPLNRRSVERAFQRDLGLRGFRQDRARMFLWEPQPDGSRMEVSGREWRRQTQSIPRDRNARILLVNDINEMTAVTYMKALPEPASNPQ